MGGLAERRRACYMPQRAGCSRMCGIVPIIESSAIFPRRGRQSRFEFT